MEENNQATAEELKDKLKEVEGICNPIVSKLYSAGGAGGGDAGSYASGDDDLPDHDDL